MVHGKLCALHKSGTNALTDSSTLDSLMFFCCTRSFKGSSILQHWSLKHEDSLNAFLAWMTSLPAVEIYLCHQCSHFIPFQRDALAHARQKLFHCSAYWLHPGRKHELVTHCGGICTMCSVSVLNTGDEDVLTIIQQANRTDMPDVGPWIEEHPGRP